MHCCNFVAAIVQSEEIESWGAQYVGKHSGIPMLQLASFATDPDGKEALRGRTITKLCVASLSSCVLHLPLSFHDSSLVFKD
jgi:hypothetical protein